jgi:hypothetical protein
MKLTAVQNPPASWAPAQKGSQAAPWTPQRAPSDPKWAASLSELENRASRPSQPKPATARSQGFFNAFLPNGRTAPSFNVASFLGPRAPAIQRSAAALRTPAEAVDGTFIRRNSEGALVFNAPIRGKTTPNAKYTRSELRETTADGKPLNWRMKDGPHGLDGELSVDAVPADRGAVVFGQIHAKNYRHPPLKLTFERRPAPEGGRVYAEFRARPGRATTRVELASGIKLGQKFSYSVTLAKNGRLTITLSSGGVTQTRNLTMTSAWNARELYFKAGAYNTTNEGPASDRSVVVYSRIATRRPGAERPG